MLGRRLIIPHINPAGPWDDVPWTGVDSFHAGSADFHPRVAVRIAHSGESIHLRWRVDDRYIVIRTTATNGPVHQDACVEWFFEPVPGHGYFNLEINAGGTVYCSHIREQDLDGGRPIGSRMLDPASLATIGVRSSLPRSIVDELPGPLTWTLDVDVPLGIFAPYVHGLACQGNWRGNLFHCAELSSRPRWTAWSPIGELLSFHQPDCFGIHAFA